MNFILGLQIPDIQRVRNEVNFEPFFVSFEGIAEGMQDVWFWMLGPICGDSTQMPQ